MITSSKSTYAVPERREFPICDDVDPCEDFWAHACSSVSESFDLRPDRSRHIFSMGDSAERLLQKKMKYLRGLDRANDLTGRAGEIRDFYQACMNEDARADEEMTAVKEVVREMAGLSNREALLVYLGERVVGPDYSFFSFSAVPNPDDSDWLDAFFPANLMTLPERSYYDKPDVMADFQAVVTQFFHILGYDDAAQRAESVVAFEKRFAQVYPLPAEWRQLFVKKEWISRSDMQSRYPHLKLGAALSHLPARTKIRQFTSSYFDFMNEALGSEDVEVLKSVYQYHRLSPIMDDAFGEYYTNKFAFRNRHLGGPPERPDRGERCAKSVMRRMRQELDAELVDIFFPGFDQGKFEELVNSVRAAMIRKLKANQWLSAKGRDAAVRKMENVDMMLVKPKREQDWNFNLPADYAADRPLANDRLHRSKGVEKSLSKLATKRNKKEWGMGPMTVNAYYNPANNQFVMPVGILQYPFYDPTLPDHINLGAVGAVVGHELGHAIDDKGSMFDEHGSLKQWMTGDDLAAFKSRTSRIIDQYDHACYKTSTGEPACHNGSLTLGENIGDLTGVSFAFEAAEFSEDPEMALIEKREFFLQYARVWCAVTRDKEMLRRLKVDPHALPHARVNEIVKHHAGFYEAFSCEAGDDMYLPEAQRVAPW
jgi:putative endopeptidase